MDEILAFAELERFADLKLKHYSSGMASRLAYAVAFQAVREVLVLDEIFAVGDAGFKAKCEERYRELRAAGHAVLLVSHEPRAISTFCDRAILIDRGRVVCVGNAPDVVSRVPAGRGQPDSVSARRRRLVRSGRVLPAGGTPRQPKQCPQRCGDAPAARREQRLYAVSGGSQLARQLVMCLLQMRGVLVQNGALGPKGGRFLLHSSEFGLAVGRTTLASSASACLCLCSASRSAIWSRRRDRSASNAAA